MSAAELNERGWHLPSVNEGLRIARVCNGYPLPGDMDLNDPHAYPTMDAYLASCRALHWRTEQLKQAGIKPLDLRLAPTNPDTGDVAHYPPNSYRFPIEECFPGDDWRQIYHGWRRFPRAMFAAGFLGLMTGVAIATFIFVL